MYSLYFDPGLGAMIIQAVVAGVAGVILFSKNLLYKIKLFFGLTKDNDDMYDDIEVEVNESDNKKSMDK